VVGAGANTCSFACVATTFTGERRITAMRILTAGYTCAFRVTPFIAGGCAYSLQSTQHARAGVLYDVYGKTVPFLLVAFVGVLIMFGWWAHNLKLDETNWRGVEEKQPLLNSQKSMVMKQGSLLLGN